LYPSEGQVSFTSVMMEIAETHDNWVPDSMLEYQFRCVTDPTLSPSNSASEGDNLRQGEIWVPYTTAFFNGLEPGRGYEFEVRARDTRDNRTEFSLKLEEVVKPGDRNMSPDPAEWYFDPVDEILVVPSITGPGEVTCVAQPYDGLTFDDVIVQYQFEVYLPGEINPIPGFGQSPWKTSTTHTFGGLTIGATYEFNLKVRLNNVKNVNEYPFALTELAQRYLMDQIGGDFYAPTPDPAQFLPGYPLDSGGVTGMQAVQAVDIIDDIGTVDPTGNASVEYYFECLDDDAYSSGGDYDETEFNGEKVKWRNVVNIATSLYPDGSGLQRLPELYMVGVPIQSGHEWRVHVRDRTPNKNATAPSAARSVAEPEPVVINP
jgi:hypothetical protein